MTDAPTLSPTQVAAIRKQLLAANTRLVAIERERRELKERIALRPRSSSVTSDK